MRISDCGLEEKNFFNPQSEIRIPQSKHRFGNFSTVAVEKSVEKSLFGVTSS
jgi:hypothetical protein